MRFLAWHVDHFRSHVTERGRASCAESFDDPDTVAENALLVLVSVEQADEDDPDALAANAAKEIAALAKQIGVGTVVLHPFAHLWGELGQAPAAVHVLKQTAERLQAGGLLTLRTPFGWLTTLDIKAKGHPLSRVAREIATPELKAEPAAKSRVSIPARVSANEQPC